MESSLIALTDVTLERSLSLLKGVEKRGETLSRDLSLIAYGLRDLLLKRKA